jgi:hypothetical protein
VTCSGGVDNAADEDVIVSKSSAYVVVASTVGHQSDPPEFVAECLVWGLGNGFQKLEPVLYGDTAVCEPK